MIDELIERVEKGEGADRELDAAISVSLHPWLAGLPRSHVGGWVHPAHGLVASPDYFTTSLDAVIALIEERLPGWACKMERNPAGLSWGAVWNRHSDKSAEAKTPARALLAAFLKAHKEQHNG